MLPDGNTEAILYLDYNKSDTCGVYRGVYFGDIQEGTYTFTVVDKDENSDTITEVLTSKPIDSPSEASLQPANNTLIGETGVIFNWDDVSEAAFYMLKLYDKDMNHLFNIYTTKSEYILPPGILKEESLYRYRIQIRREFFEDNEDNGSSVPSRGVWNANTFVTTKTNGSAAPSLNLDSYGVAVWHVPNPVTGSSVYWLEFYSMVTDSDGVPENIEKVEVIYPDGTTTRLLKYDDSPNWGSNYYDYELYTDPSLIPSGTYTFRVVDFDGNEVTLQDKLTDVTSNILPWATGATPADNTFATITLTITWDSIPGASYYAVRIMSSWAYPTVHWSDKLTQTQYTVPDGILSLNTTYGYRIYAYRENEVDFYSCNHSWHLANYRFTTQQDTPTGDDVIVQPVDNAGDTPVTITFHEVTVPGTTLLTTSDQGNQLPAGFKLGDPPVYYEITTTAQYSGQIEVCVDYSGVSYDNEEELKLFHYEIDQWKDVTSWVDTESDVICGIVTSLSTFAIFEPSIIIDGCNTGVGDGEYNDKLVSEWITECGENAKNHGKFVSCVAGLTNELKKAGVITGEEKGAIQSCAAQANIP